MALDYSSLANPAKPQTSEADTAKPGEQKDRKPLERKVKGKVKVREKGPIQKMAGSFFEEDLANVKTYVIQDVVIPLIKDAIADSFIGALEMLLYGTTGGGRNRRRTRAASQNPDKLSYTAYNRFSDGSSVTRTSSRTRTSSADAYDYESLIFETRGDAEAALIGLRETLDQYNVATVADLYDLAGLTAPFTDQKFGWKNLDEAHVKRAPGGGWIIVLPKARSIVQ